MKTQIIKQNLHFKIFLLAVICFAFIQKANSQATIVDAYATLAEINGANSYNGTYYVELTDSVFSELEISLGNTQSSNDIASYTYSYDVTSGLPSNWTYQRVGTKLTLGIGQYADHSIYFGSARVKDSNGQWSVPFAFVGN